MDVRILEVGIFSRQPFYLQDVFVTNHVVLRREAVGQRTANHQTDDLVHRQLFRRARGDPLAVAHDGHVVGNPQNFLHLVGDVDDAAAALLEHVDDAEKVLNLRLRQGGGRFVKDDDLGVEGNRLRNFDHLPLRNRHRAHHGSRVDVDPQIVKDFLRIVVALLVGDKRQSLFDQRIASQPNVIHDRALERLIQLLVNHGNAVVQRFSGGFEVDLFTVEVNVTGIFGINAEQTLHQRRFSRAVLTHQGVNRSRSHGKLRIIQRLYTGETLADALHTKKYVLFHVCASPFRQKTALRPVLPTH